MRILKCDIHNPASVAAAAEKAFAALQKGCIIVYPTDTAYGLGANALDEKAIARIYCIKGRDAKKPLSIAVRDIAMARRVAVVSPIAEKFLERVWPGPVTVILPKRSVLPDVLTDGGPVGIRYSRDAFTEALFARIDFPVTATSANLSGEGAVYNVRDFVKQLRGKTQKPDLVIDAGILPPVVPSTVIDLTGKEPKVLRAGPVSQEGLFKILKETSA